MRRTAALILAAALLAGCSDDGGSTVATGSPSPSATPTASATTAAPSGTTTPTASATRALRPGKPSMSLVGVFTKPLYLTAPAGDPRLFVVEKAGRIRIVQAGKTLPVPFLDIASMVSDEGERGLLSLAFAPDYATSRRAYVYYTANDGDLTLVEYQADGSNPDVLAPSTRRVLLEVPHPRSNHNGGTLAFDSAGMLLLSMGDGGGANDPSRNAQNLGVLLGKIIRIDPRPSGGRPYAIPADNPFVDHSGARPEVYAYGLRNPWRYSLDADGTFLLGDVGQYAVEEINVVTAHRVAGSNFGWPAFEGDRRTGRPLDRTGTLVSPAYTYGHTSGGCAVTGGVVHRGDIAALHGQYLFADYCEGEVMAAVPGTTLRPRPTGLPIIQELASFGLDGAGNVYVVSQGGRVLRITV